MGIRSKLRPAPTFLALYIGAAFCAIAATGLEVTQKPQEISGIDWASGVAFQAQLPSNDRVIIDTSVGSKQIHAEIDYKLKKIVIRSLSKTSGARVALSPQDIAAFQKLRVVLPRSINIGTRHGDALTSLINLMASAPPVALNVNILNGSFTPICNEIGGPGVATYALGDVLNIKHDTVTVGPVCYSGRALGRCGALAGPDFGIGLDQIFTQECLNHDQCCDVTGGGFLCGASFSGECIPEFLASIPSFLFGPDCGTTEGTWMDVTPAFPIGPNYTIKGGDSSPSPLRNPTTFTGTVEVDNGYFACEEPATTWPVMGTRDGPSVQFTATNPAGTQAVCPPKVLWEGAFTDCNKASGTEKYAAGGAIFPNGAVFPWAWQRTNTVGAQAVSHPTGAASPAKLP